MSDEAQATDRADVRQLAVWLASELARDATRIELRDARSISAIATWAPTSDATELAREIVGSAVQEVERVPDSMMIATCANEPVRVVEAARLGRTVVVISFAPGGPSTLRLTISNDEAEPVSSSPAVVLRQALRRLATLASLRTSPTTSVHWLLFERLVAILGASDARVERIAEQLDPADLIALAELLATGPVTRCR